MVKNTKGSLFYGVYKCLKTNKYYSKNFRNKVCHKSKLYKNEIDAAKQYDKFVLTNNPNSSRINFPKVKKLKKLKKVSKLKTVKKNNIVLLKKSEIQKRPKILEYVKIIIYSRQDEKCILCKNNLGVGRIIDHIIPRSIGGLDNINNYQAICGTCNKWKTYSFDHCLRHYIKNNNIKNIKLDTILNMQKKEYNKFNGPYICE